MRSFGAGVGVLATITSLLYLSATSFAAPTPPTLAATAIDRPMPAAGDSLPNLLDDPLVMTAEMQEFLDQRVTTDQARPNRLLALRDAIFDPQDGLGITYGAAGTHTAAGTFRARSGNCLSFTFLFVAMARHLDFEAYFVEVDEVTGWSQRGDVSLTHWHMFAEVEVDNSTVRIDFLPWVERTYRSNRRISEARALAHFHNNVGAEALASDDTDIALRHFRRALELDDTFSPARVNYAVALRRAGQATRAIDLLLEVLDDEPGNAQAAANLAGTYALEGRNDEAQRWLKQRQAFLKRNPFHHFRLGLQALSDEAPAQARSHFKRAILRQPDEAVFFENLAEAHRRLGDEQRARASLKRAARLTVDPERRKALERRVESSHLDTPSRPSGDG